HRRYAREEAAAYLAAGAGFRVAELFSGERLRRRRALKRLSYSLPLRPVLRFVYQYVLRRGFLDGGPGLRYCRLLARYEGFSTEEIRRLRSAARPRAPDFSQPVLLARRARDRAAPHGSR